MASTAGPKAWGRCRISKLPNAARTDCIQWLKDEGSWAQNGFEPQFFRHAEFTTLYLAASGLVKDGVDEPVRPVRPMPEKLAMDAGRKLCKFDDGCAENLHSVIGWFGIKELYIRDCHDAVMKITKNSSKAEKLPGTYDLAAWAAFKSQHDM